MSVSHRVLCESVSFNVCLRHLIIRYKSHQADKQITHLLVIEKQWLKHLIVNHLSPPNWGKKWEFWLLEVQIFFVFLKVFFSGFPRCEFAFMAGRLCWETTSESTSNRWGLFLNIDCHFPNPVFVFDVILGREGSYIYLLWWGSSKHVLERFLFFLSLMIQQNADRWPYWVLFRWLNCNMWSWFEWHTYAADREDCCIQSWSMTCLRVWSIPEGRWKEEAVTRTLATTQRVWMPNLMGEKSRRKGLWWWFCDSMATRP